MLGVLPQKFIKVLHLFMCNFLESVKSIEQEMAERFSFESNTWTPVNNAFTVAFYQYAWPWLHRH